MKLKIEERESAYKVHRIRESGGWQIIKTDPTSGAFASIDPSCPFGEEIAEAIAEYLNRRQEATR